MKREFSNGYVVKNEMMGICIPISEQRELPNEFVTIEDIIGWVEIPLRSRIEWIMLNAMTTKEALRFTLEVIKIVIPLDEHQRKIFNSWKGRKKLTVGQIWKRRIFRDVINVGNKYFEKNIMHKEFKEKLASLHSEASPVIGSGYPWVGYATKNFVFALECELQGGQVIYNCLGGYKHKRNTKRFLCEALLYSFAAIGEVLAKTNFLEKKIRTSHLKKIEILLRGSITSHKINRLGKSRKAKMDKREEQTKF